VKESAFKLKIMAGYLAPLLAGGFIIWYIFACIAPLITTEDRRTDAVFDKVALLAATLSSFSENEVAGLLLVQRPTSANYTRYRESAAKVYMHIDSLSAMMSAPSQQLIVQGIMQLIALKTDNLNIIIRQMNAENDEQIIRESMSNVLHEVVDTIPVMVVLRDRVVYDTLPPADKPKNLWARIGDVFSPTPPDTTARTRIRRIRTNDTLTSVFNAYDTLFNTLEKILDNVYVEKTRYRRTISRKLQTLLATDQRISAEINALLDDLQQEALALTRADFDERERFWKKTGNILFVVGILAAAAIMLFLFVIFHDLNKRRTYRRQLEEARITAEELMRSREKLLLSISHDIRAPLSAIAGHLEGMQIPTPNRDDRLAIRAMNASIRHVMVLLNNLLEYARLKANRMTLAPSVFPLRAPFDDMMASFYPLAKKKHITLTLNNTIDAALYVETDKTRLQQVLTNLLSNALKFTDEGGITITAATVRDRDEKNQQNDDGNSLLSLRFSISDTGCGIPDAKKAFIFDEFFQVNGGDHHSKGGSGFGLYIVKQTVDALHGTVEMMQNRPHGTRFTVQIPLRRVPTPATPATEAHPPVATPTLIRRLLVVDDDPAQGMLMENILAGSGHAVRLAQTIDEAETCLEQMHIDLVMTDIQLGRTDGFQLLDRLRNSDRKDLQSLPVVAISADEEHDNAYFKARGFADFLRKPFTVAQFLLMLHRTAPPVVRYNTAGLTTMMNGDTEAVREIMETFITSSRDHCARLQTALTTDDFPAIKQTAHTILPMAEQLEMTELVALLSFLRACPVTPRTRELFIDKTKTVCHWLSNIR
jgi:signal transduction histidine kinase/ActR/RegA family two-component response regulator